MTILWFGLYDPQFGRNKIYREALETAGHTIIECQDTSGGISKYIRLWKKHTALKGKYDVLVVGYPGHIVTPLAQWISDKKVVVDALGSLYDAEINSHRAGILRRIKNRIADRLMVRYADVILLESEAQKSYFEVHFGASEKYRVVYTGAWKEFENQSVRLKHAKKDPGTFTVLFRGKLTPECGIMYMVEAASLLKDSPHIRFVIAGSGYLKDKVEAYIRDQQLNNVELVTRYLSTEELVGLYSADVALGQFENNPRLNRTIPHKAFEAFATKTPFISGDAPAIREIVTDDETAFLVPLADASAIARRIKDISARPELLRHVSESSQRLYQEKFSQVLIARKLASIML